MKCFNGIVSVAVPMIKMSGNVNSVPCRNVPCYFCNEFIEEKYLFDHVQLCGSVLEECSQKCGVYVQRRNMDEHGRTCHRDAVRRTNSRIEETRDSLWKNKVFLALSLLRASTSNEEKERRNLENSLSWCSKSLDAQRAIIDTLRLQVAETKEESRRCDTALRQRLNSLESYYENIEQQTSTSFQNISEQLKLLHEELTDEQYKIVDDIHLEFESWCSKLKDLKGLLIEESAQVNRMWQEQQTLIHDLKLELEMRCKLSKELTTEQNLVKEKVDSLKEEMQKQSTVLSNQKITMKEIKFRLKENFEYLKGAIDEIARSKIVESVERRCEHECCDRYSNNGRLLWRIDRYKEKMTDAKENDSVLYSPKFLNKEYGYTLRIVLCLNGIGQWKDRHIIGCLRVENGKWDPLLDWPCVLKASVTLRNQENPANDVKKMVKAVGKDKTNSTDVTKEAGIYMFIPHTTLTRYSGYVQDNTLFFDVEVKGIEKRASTLSLVS